jgi:hypothetical protein
MRDFIKRLGQLEGINLHRNKTEEDITAPYGIYRYAHPNAEIFKYIDSVARDLGIRGESKEWTTEEIEEINERLNSNIIRDAAIAFYRGFLNDIELPSEIMLSYVNSPYLTMKAVQQSIINFQNQDLITKDFVPSPVDGIWGKKTKKGLSLIENHLHFLSEFKSNMKTQYVQLALSKQNFIYLRGWINRLDP